jgi:alpha-ketoglutarate-dependent taurine dioxygenase
MERTVAYDYIRVEPLSTALGAEISGVDLAEAPPERVLAEIRHAFGEHGVIFFRDQQLRPNSISPLPSVLAVSTSTASSRPCPVIQ